MSIFLKRWAELECKNQHAVITYANTSFGKKISIFLKKKKMGDDVTLVQCPFNQSLNVKILLYICDTYNCDYLPHTTFHFFSTEFQLNTDFSSKFYIFECKIT